MFPLFAVKRVSLMRELLIERFQEIIKSTAHLILEFSQEGGSENAAGF